MKANQLFSALGDELQSALRAAGGGNEIVADQDRLPPLPGAYLLILWIASVGEITVRGVRHHVPAGLAVYAGSARGPGGISARLGRHLRGSGRPHWHIDHLVPLAAARAGIPIPGGSECAALAPLRGAGGQALIPGFGASDCRTCDSHLLIWPDGGDG